MNPMDDILIEFISGLANDPWVEAHVREKAQRALEQINLRRINDGVAALGWRPPNGEAA